MHVPIESKHFGRLANGKIVDAWVVRGTGGLTFEAITYGATITRLLVPDQHGETVDVALGFRDLESYVEQHPYFGSIVGRVAGRLAGASFELDGQRYHLEANDFPNHLHGGNRGLHRRLWSARILDRAENGPCIRFEYDSQDGEEGYPGTVKIAVNYSVTHDNALRIEITALSDRVTPFSPTSHLYFNLAGESSGTIEGHELQIHAEAYVPVDDRMTLTDQLKQTEGSTEDFRQPQELQKAIRNLFQRHGSLYLLATQNEYPPRLKCAALLRERRGGRYMRVLTTEPFLQFYSGSQLDGSLVGKSGIPYRQHAGLCLECHGYPNGPTCSELGNIMLQPGRLRRYITAFAFGSVNAEDSTS